MNKSTKKAIDLYDKKQYKQAFELIEHSEDVQAHHLLALMYFYGRGVQSQITKSLDHFHIAMKNGYMDSFFEFGRLTINIKIDKFRETALIALEYAAKHNHAEALNYLGTLYLDDKFVEKDIHKAISYYKRAEKENHPDAIFALGAIYYDDLYGLMDPKKAFDKFSYLIKNFQDKRAFYMLGMMYLEEKGVKQDLMKAIKYLTQSALRNYARAEIAISRVYLFYVTQEEKKIAVSLEFLIDAHKQKIDAAQDMLNILYELSVYSIKKTDIADLKYYTKNQKLYDYVVNQREINIYIFARLKMEGICVEKDTKLGMKWMEKLIEDDYPMAFYAMGVLYKYGHDVNVNLKKAFQLLNEAINRNIQPAFFEMLDLIENYNFKHELINDDYIDAIKYYINHLYM